MSRTVVDIYRKAVLDANISGKDWNKTEAYDEFTRYFNAAYTETQRQSMKYDAILKISQAWWSEHRSKYS
ncbi:MAG TPA: hypothetical protein VHP11_14205 [Tepidisphaeraceae bacterium]|nr:hypothetical protein [Tepidisphaeraceae bacterium]